MIKNEKPSPKHKRKELILKTLHENLYNSTAQILLKIYESPYFLVKLICVSIVISSAGFCSYAIISNISSYLAYEVNTMTRRITNHEVAMFPVISICNKNIFNSEFSLKFLKQVLNENGDYLNDVFNETLMRNKTFTEREKSVYDLK